MVARGVARGARADDSSECDLSAMRGPLSNAGLDVCAACLLKLAAADSPSDALTATATGSVTSARGLTTQLKLGEVFGPYRIDRLLGSGGMGEVYEAEHLAHERRVALKVLNRRLSDPADRARFLREGELAASVNHPNSVYIFGSEEIAGVPIIAMELLPGGTLKESRGSPGRAGAGRGGRRHSSSDCGSRRGLPVGGPAS